MTRLPRLARDTLAGAQAALFDRIAGTERPDQRPRLPRVGPDGALEGPFNALLRNPGLGTLLQDLGDEVRYRITLTDRCREIAILTVAAAWHSEYERYAHGDIARAIGLTDAEVAAVEAGSAEPFTDETELLVARTARALARAHDLADDEYAAAVAGLGERGLFELVTLVGYYSQIALALRVFRVMPPE